MLRNLLLIIAIAVIIWIIRGFIRRARATPTRTIESRDTVQCLQCKTYIPRDEAIIVNGQAFCSQKHLDDWNTPT